MQILLLRFAGQVELVELSAKDLTLYLMDILGHQISP